MKHLQTSKFFSCPSPPDVRSSPVSAEVFCSPASADLFSAAVVVELAVVALLFLSGHFKNITNLITTFHHTKHFILQNKNFKMKTLIILTFSFFRYQKYTKF